MPLDWPRARKQVQLVRDAMRGFHDDGTEGQVGANTAEADDFTALAIRLSLFLNRHQGLRAYIARERRHTVPEGGWGIIHEVFAFRLVQRYANEKAEGIGESNE